MNDKEAQSRLSRADFYKLINGKVDHQDNLVDQRVSWLVISEAFFFMAFGTLVSTPSDAQSQYAAQRGLWYWIIPVSGLFAGLCTYIAVVSSLLHIGELNRLMVHSNQQSRQEDSSATDFPPIQGSFLIRHAAKISCLSSAGFHYHMGYRFDLVDQEVADPAPLRPSKVLEQLRQNVSQRDKLFGTMEGYPN